MKQIGPHIFSSIFVETQESNNEGYYERLQFLKQSKFNWKWVALKLLAINF